jgi:phosphoribosylaminoimidazolecarboxamide formyltransferase / IMP cyclohydrolase
MAEFFRALDGGSRVDGGYSKRTQTKPAGSDLTELLRASEAVGDLVAIKTALATVSDKSGLKELGRVLAKFRVGMIATEGTAAHLNDKEHKGLKLINLSDYTKFPENLNGRLKTLHHKIQAGVLGIKGKHEKILSDLNASFIDLVVVNLYPFEQVAAKQAKYFECIENIDIGGPALLRAAAKNHACVTAVCDPNDYEELIRELEANDGKTTLAFRRKCAMKVFELTSKYDQAIAAWFRSKL